MMKVCLLYPQSLCVSSDEDDDGLVDPAVLFLLFFLMYKKISNCPPTCCSSYLDDVMVPPILHGSVQHHFSPPRFQETPPPPPSVHWWRRTPIMRIQSASFPIRVLRRKQPAPPSFPLDWAAVSPGPSRRTPSAFPGSPSAESPSYWLLESAATAVQKETLTMMKRGVSPHFNRDLVLKYILASF